MHPCDPILTAPSLNLYLSATVLILCAFDSFCASIAGDSLAAHTALAKVRSVAPARMQSVLPHVIAIEGNIGVGKSTQIRRLAELFEDNSHVVVLPEPVDEWVEKGFLQGMYDGSISKGEFQSMVLMSILGDLLKALARKPTPALIITERSPWSNRFVFGKANLVGASLDLYEHTWERVLGGLPSELDVKYVYLKTKVDTIVARMMARGRDAEAGVPREYLETLDKNHDDFIWNETYMHAIIDGDRNEEAVWHDLCVQLREWTDELGDELGGALQDTDMSTKQASELKIIHVAAREVSLRLELECPNPGRASKRARYDPETA